MCSGQARRPPTATGLRLSTMTSLTRTITIGNREVFRVGLGMGPLAHANNGAGDPEAARRLLPAARELGVQLFDTAAFYGDHVANAMLAAAFGPRTGANSTVVYATKVGARPTPQGPVPMAAAQHPDELRDAITDNLTSLHTDHLDLVYLRRMDMTPGLVATGEQAGVPLDDQLATLIAERDAGRIGAIGLSHVSLDQLRAAADADIAAVQNIHSVADRTNEDLLDYCTQHGIAWIPYFPLGGSGVMGAMTRAQDLPAVIQVAAETGLSPTAVGLAWHLNHSDVSALVPGTTSVEHLRANAEVSAVTLSAEHMRLLDAAS